MRQSCSNEDNNIMFSQLTNNFVDLFFGSQFTIEQNSEPHSTRNYGPIFILLACSSERWLRKAVSSDSSFNKYEVRCSCFMVVNHWSLIDLIVEQISLPLTVRFTVLFYEFFQTNLPLWEYTFERNK